MECITSEQQAQLRKAGYILVGKNRHSAVKACLWCKHSIVNKGECYKQKFYGIESHRCLQFTPSLPFCNHKCVFCWRNTSITFPKWIGKADSPEELVEEAITAQRKLLNGFPGNPETNIRKFREAQDPNQVAISLAGEPTFYPHLGELVKLFHEKKMTTFLVSNGTNPNALQKLADENALPTQLYLSLSSYDAESFKRMHVPLTKDNWKRFNESLELLQTLKTRSVLRMTLAKNLNLKNAEDYAKLIEKSQADYVEVKAYMAVGYSRERLGLTYMPTSEEIRKFAEELSEESGYVVSDKHAPSMVVLLSRDRKAEKGRMIKKTIKE